MWLCPECFESGVHCAAANKRYDLAEFGCLFLALRVEGSVVVSVLNICISIVNVQDA